MPKANDTQNTQSQTSKIDAQTREEPARMDCLLTNPYRTTHDLREEADRRLETAEALLTGIGGLRSRDIQPEDAQAACIAASLLIGDARGLMDSVLLRAEKGKGPCLNS